ncbi:MAG: hypothetical protein HQK84_03535 [Nitrospinae bacterium]|nr:hypothetical protein [Nitrospinota bacterium]
MNIREKRKFIELIKETLEPESKAHYIHGALKNLKISGRGFKLTDLRPFSSEKGISKQAIKKALMGKGAGNIRPGCQSDLVRKKTAKLLDIKKSDLWPNLYSN